MHIPDTDTSEYAALIEFAATSGRSRIHPSVNDNADALIARMFSARARAMTDFYRRWPAPHCSSGNPQCAYGRVAVRRSSGSCAMSVKICARADGAQRIRAAVAEVARAVAEHGGAGGQPGHGAGDRVLDHGAARRVDAQRVRSGEVDIRGRLGARRFVAAEDAAREAVGGPTFSSCSSHLVRGPRPRRRRCGRPACACSARTAAGAPGISTRSRSSASLRRARKPCSQSGVMREAGVRLDQTPPRPSPPCR